MHADRRHRRGRLGSIDVVDKDHRVTFVRRAFPARGHARATADATLRIDEHCLLHGSSSTSIRSSPLLLPLRLCDFAGTPFLVVRQLKTAKDGIPAKSQRRKDYPLIYLFAL